MKFFNFFDFILSITFFSMADNYKWFSEIDLAWNLEYFKQLGYDFMNKIFYEKVIYFLIFR